MPEISERIYKKLVTMVVSRKGNWERGRRETYFSLFLYLLNLINIDYIITFLEINIL